LGFSSAVLPAASSELPKGTTGKWNEVESLPDLVARIAGSRLKARSEEAGD
ncbi:MAG: DNA repair protein RadA, partial [Rhizobium sp.]|nr:DNA repair protein RadA [Rhizobium sp.]